MKNNAFNQLNKNKYKISDNAQKPYWVQNEIVKKAEIPTVKEPLNDNVPAEKSQPQNENEPDKRLPANIKTGYIAVGVFTALGALPVPDAVVTIYTINESGEENAIYQLITDENGRIPNLELPVSYDPTNPLESSKYYFSIYNMRVQAINYYTVNVIDIRVFPNITTSYKVDLIPAMPGPTTEHHEKTIIIPPSLIDKSNE